MSEMLFHTAFYLKFQTVQLWSSQTLDCSAYEYTPLAMSVFTNKVEGSSHDLVGHALLSPVLKISFLTPKHTKYEQMHVVELIVSFDVRCKTPLSKMHEKIKRVGIFIC